MAECEEIISLSKQHDANGNGTLDDAEITAVMSGIGFSEEDCEKMFAEADWNMDGVIQFAEFVSWAIEEETLEDESAAPFMTHAFELLTKGIIDPFMKQAFELLTKGITDLATVVMEGGSDPEASVAKEDARQRRFVELLGKSFDRHNKSGSGTLDPEEAKIIFSNLVSHCGAFLDSVVAISTKKFMALTVKTMIAAMVSEKDARLNTDVGTKIAMVSAMREGLKKELKKAKTKTAKQLQEYMANKQERDAAAFQIIDVDGTGTIGKEEFLVAFTPGSKKSDEVMAALGIEPPEDP